MESTKVLISPTLLKTVPEPVISPGLPIKTSSCPWSKVTTVEAVSLNDVMSEQLAQSLVEVDQTCDVPQNVYVFPFCLL